MHSYTVSIVIVTYNAENFLKTCLESVINQPFKNKEIIIIDGNSTDKTLQIINSYSEHISIWISEPDLGIYDAMNKSIKYIKGKWVLFLGADDLLLEGFNEFSACLKNQNEVYYGDCITENTILGGKFSNYRLAKMNICHQAIFYPTYLFNRYFYNTIYNVFADYDLNIRIWGNNSIRKNYIPLTISKYNTTGFSSTNIDLQFKKDKSKIICKNFNFFVYSRYLLKKWKEQRKGNRFF